MALQYALVGTARCANTRSNYVTAAMTLRSLSAVTFTINGTDRSRWVNRFESEIIDTLNDAANTASLVVRGFTPAAGQTVVITRTLDGSKLFSGVIVKLTLLRRIAGSRIRYRLDCLDWSFLLDRRLVTNFYTTQSASTIAADLITTWTSGFTSTNVEAALPSVEFQNKMETVSRALTRLADLVGAFWYVDYDKDLHFRVTENLTNPATLDTTITTYKRVTYGSSIPQIRTRVKVEGGGVTALTEVAASESVLPVDDTTWYDTAGGYVVAGTQQITYTGVQAGGGGALVGPSISPSAPPVATLAAGAGLGLGLYQYAYTDVTAIGETLPSPVGTVTTLASETVPTPTVAPTVASDYVGILGQNGGTATDWNGTDVSTGPHIGDTLQYAYTWSTSATPADLTFSTAISPLSSAHTVTTYLGYGGGWITAAIPKITVPLPDARVRYIHLYRKRNGGTLFFTGTIINANGANGYQVQDTTVTGSVVPPAANAVTTEQKQVALTGIALGPAGTTSRNVYRTTAGGSQLKLQQTIANNTATSGVTDVTADGSLGANAPTSDTAGLTGVVSIGQGFYTGATFSTDGAATLATTAPVFTSATYTFLAGDVGATIYIKTGANWTVGRYLILSVSAGAAFLNAPCASVASPTVGTWGIDYSALATQTRFTYTDLVVDATFTTKITSAALPFGSNVLGNVLVFAGGIGFTAQRVIAMSIGGAAVLTCDKAVGTLNATAGQGTILGTTAVSQVNAGSTTIPTAGAGAFASTGGWLLTGGGAFVRYTGISGNTLTGIPTSGVGAIVATLLYGSPIKAVPALTGIPTSGVGSILYAIKLGDPINLLVVVDAVAAQTALATLEGGDGIHEHYIQDRRLSVDGAAARASAELALGATPEETVAVTSEDWLCQSGRSLVVNVAGISVTLKMHQVRIYWTVGRHYPQRDVTATNRFKDFYQYVREIEDSARRAV